MLILKRMADYCQKLTPESAKIMSALRTVLQYYAVRFILPNEGMLFEPDSLSERHYSLLKLPFEVCAFEAPWEGNSPPVDITGMNAMSISNRRIALTIESKSKLAQIIPGAKEKIESCEHGGVFVIPIYFQGDKWMICLIEFF